MPTCSFKAVLLDQDGTLTRVIGDADPFFYSTYESHKNLLTQLGRADDILTTEQMKQMFAEKDRSVSMLYLIPERLGLSYEDYRQAWLAADHSHMIIHDTDSADVLNANRDRILLFTDALNIWCVQRSASVGHGLQMQSAEDHPDGLRVYEMKLNKGPRWQRAVQQLRTMTGMPDLQPCDIIVIDDSEEVLAAAQHLGFQTGQATFGFPARPHNPKWDYHVPHVGTFLQQSGFVRLAA